MAYDAKKDKILWEGGFDDIAVTVRQYDGGPAKVQVMRSYEKKDGSTGFGKTGRLTMDEFDKLCYMRNNVATSVVQEDAR